MLPFGLKVAWVALSATGLLSCWIVLWAFSRAVNMKWGPILYAVGNTLLQGMFCLGMIYRMDPFLMPHSFCVGKYSMNPPRKSCLINILSQIAQVIIISLGAFMIAGVTLAFSLATTLTVLKPKTWGDGVGTGLKWRTFYLVPIVGFPVVASIVHIALVIKFDSAQPSDDMHCDSTAPEWVRLAGYSGVPFVMAWPSLYLAVKSIIRISKTNRHIQRARPTSDEFTPVPHSRTSSRGRKMNFIPSSRMKIVFSPPSPTSPMSSRREAIQPAIASPALTARKFHLPFKAPAALTSLPEVCRSNRNSSSVSTRDNIPMDDTSSSTSRMSASFPMFVNPDAPPSAMGSADMHSKDTEHVGGEERGKDGREVGDWDEGKRDSEQATEREWAEDNKVDLEDEEDDIDVVAKEEYVMSFKSGDSTYNPRSPRPGSTLYQHKTRRPIPNLAPAVWRIILFQVAFTSVQFLGCISTIIDLVRKQTPAPLGTQHFALLLAAWGPVIVFGHLPAVRRNLVPWRPMS
ncbi:hypothetical protein BDN70DRAFT_855953 [Pholiota conissans]|uniref:Uncharacterized protein n=1 Tax=Pholiota conissans TaxID=109636 RepID=A0A9P6D2Q9_9AGAR|nr:hypothetical protein BDN70DRAFT_855953 [Pholiota conissans]